MPFKTNLLARKHEINLRHLKVGTCIREFHRKFVLGPATHNVEEPQ